MTILCIASYEKGHEFLRECRRSGCRVLLLTSLTLKDEAQWPLESIDEIFYMPDENRKWDRQQTINAVSFLARTQRIERIVPLDDFDLEMAASLREHLRIGGMGETTTRYFRDKLAMRVQALDRGLEVPDFVHVLHHETITRYAEMIPPPWVLKPRFMAGAIGIKLVHDTRHLWELIHALGDEQSNYLLERYIPGDIFHVDTIVYEREIRFTSVSRYGTPPMDVSHGGGVFTTSIVERGSDTERDLLAQNRRVMEAMGLVRGVSHTEFIKSRETGAIFFLETSARVGGANIVELIEAATGLNLWAEWAKVEIAGGKVPYNAPEPRKDYAGLLVSLAKQEWPDTATYDDPEIVWRMKKKNHVGLIVRSADRWRIAELLDKYVQRVRQDFLATAPPRERPTS
jgi:biotin carboxylase